MGSLFKKIFNIKNLMLFLISLFLFSGTAIVFASPNLDTTIKKDLNHYLNSLSKGDIKEYYEIYNTRRLTDLDKNRFYEKIKKAIEVVDEEKEVFLKHKFKLTIKDINVVDKINTNIFLCNLKVNYKFRPNINKTETIQTTEDYLVKIIDIGNNNYKILLPFNSFDKDFSSSLFFKNLELIRKEKKSLEIEKKRLEEEKLEEEKNESNIEKIEDEVYILQGDNSNIEQNINKIDSDKIKNDTNEINQNNNQVNNEVNNEQINIDNNESSKEVNSQEPTNIEENI